MKTLQNISIARIGTRATTPGGSQGTVTAGTLDQLLQHLQFFADEGLKCRCGSEEELARIIGVLLNFRIEQDGLVVDFEPLQNSEQGQALLAADPAQLEIHVDGDFMPNRDGEIQVRRIRCGLVHEDDIPDPAQVKAQQEGREQFKRAFAAALEEQVAVMLNRLEEVQELKDRTRAQELAARRRERIELALEVAKAEEVNARRKEAARKAEQSLEHYRNFCARCR